MTTAALFAFWGTLATFAFTYAAFPLLVAAIGRVRGRTVWKANIAPPITLVIAAHNEERTIGPRLQNALAADYPGTVEVIVACDGCTDRTAEVAETFADRGVRVLRLDRVGKLRALDAAVQAATGQILAFSDANALVAPDAFRALARNFADPAVGGVVGRTDYRIAPRSENSSLGERLYWRYDTRLKELESRTGSVVSAHGALYAVLRSLYVPNDDPAITDDFAISTAVVLQGYRLVFEPDARAFELAVHQSSREFSRRVRLMTRGFRGVAIRRALLNPFHYGFYSVTLFCHKLLRRLLVLGLPALLLASLVLAPAGSLYAAAATAQLLFYTLAGAGWAARRRPLGRRKWLYVPFYYCMAHLAAAIALFSFLRGRRIEAWQPQRHPSGA